MGWRIDPQQRRECHGKVHWFGVRAVNSDLEGKTVKCERNVRVIGVGRRVIRSLAGHVERGWDAQYIPSACGRIAVEVLASKFRVWHVAAGELCASEVAAQSRLLHGLPHAALRIFFFYPRARKGL